MSNSRKRIKVFLDRNKRLFLYASKGVILRHMIKCKKYKKCTKKARNNPKNAVFRAIFASVRGFEPPAYRLGGGRSILLSYTDKGIFMGVYAPKNRYHILCLRWAHSNSEPGAFCPKSNKSTITLGGRWFESHLCSAEVRFPLIFLYVLRVRVALRSAEKKMRKPENPRWITKKRKRNEGAQATISANPSCVFPFLFSSFAQKSRSGGCGLK